MPLGNELMDYCSLPLTRTPDPFIMVLFGATGDLSRRKLIPAVYSLFEQKLLTQPFALVAFARRPGDDASFREQVREAVKSFSPRLPLEGPIWDAFAKRVFYHRSEMDDAEGFRTLGDRLDQIDLQEGLHGNRLFYLATPPAYFTQVTDQLGHAGMVCPYSTDADAPWSRVIVEKPFGYDLESARSINAALLSFFTEQQIFRIDHYLGKETVQNILVTRFANKLFELIWNQSVIENVQITVAETLGIEGRGAYFDHSGTTRDMIQNHALQILTLVAMEPPVDLSADAIRDEKVKVLRSLRPFDDRDIKERTVRGQYTDGIIRGDAPEGPITAIGYQREEGVEPGSRTETFAAIRFYVDNWRWGGVPFYVRAGKRMPVRVTEVTLQLKAIPDVLFARMECAEVLPNLLTIRIQPHEGIQLRMSAKVPGPRIRVQPVDMRFDYALEFDRPILDAYERLILDAILGEAALFARADEVEAAWKIITPVLQAWERLPDPPEPYFAGTWGPRGAEEFLRREGSEWLSTCGETAPGARG